MKNKNTHFLILLLLHAIACIVIVVAFLPMAKWYFNNPTLPPSTQYTKSNPLWGVDFYYTASLTRLLRDNFVLPPAGWGYAWFTGWPLLSNYPILHYYLILPFTHFFDIISAVKIWMLVSLALFFIGLYAVFYLLAENVAFAIVLSIAAIYSVGVYGTLLWGGSLPSHASQLFLPWVVFFLLLYLKKQKSSYLLLSALLAGIGIWGHPQVVIAYIYPFSAILLIFSFWGRSLFSRIKALFIFVGISFLIGLPFLYPSLGGALSVLVVTDSKEVTSSTARTPSTTAQDILAFHRAQPARIYIDTNTTVFLLLAVSFLLFFILFLFTRKRKSIQAVLPFIVLALYSSIYVWIFAFGISIYHGGWYRLFWATPLWLGMLASSLWGRFQVSVKEINGRIFSYAMPIVSVVLLAVGLVSVFSFSDGIRDRIILRSNPSSAFPDVVNTHTDSLSWEKLKKQLVPAWIPAEETNFRFFSADQTVNIWWNALYNMPLARGYLDPPFPSRGYVFLLDTALSQDAKTGKDQLEAAFHYPADVAFNNTLFLIDWYAIKYFEAGHAGPTAYAPIPSKLTTNTFMSHKEVLDFNKNRYRSGNETLNFYGLKDAYVSPILGATNAKTVGIIATDGGYETIIRGIADMNLSSRTLIPVKLGGTIDALSLNDLVAMDALILYDYQYNNKERAFHLMSDYVQKGKKILVDTGVEVKESNTNGPLPEIFPIDKTFRKPMGRSWKLEIVDQTVGKNIDFSQFDPPLFDKYEWKLSYPQETSDVRSDAKIILKNKGIPLMVSQKMGEGEVLWSGLNLPYHVIRSHNIQEVKFFKNVIMTLLPNLHEEEMVSGDVTFVSPQRREIAVNAAAAGILFKEQAFAGWNAEIRSGGKSQNLPIYKVGPAIPGFMYVRLPSDFVQEHPMVIFSYSGSVTNWFLTLFSFLIGLFICEEIFIGGRVLGKMRRTLWKTLYHRVHKWWGREDE